MVDAIRLLLRADGRVSLRALAHSHGWSQLPPFGWDDDAGVLHRTEQLGTLMVEFEFAQATGDTIELSVRSEAGLSAADQDEVFARARWMLSLDEPLDEFYRLCEDDAHLAHVPAEGRGRMLRSSSVFEDAIKCICTTNTTWAQTKGMVRRLVETLGTSRPAFDGHAFPTPQGMAAAGESVLRDEVRLGYRTPYVYELARQVADRELDLEALRFSTQPTAELRKQLLKIKGIGPYAAASLLVLVGRYDHIGVDSWAQKLVSEQFYAGQPVTEAQVQSAFESFGRWRALAYYFYRWDHFG